MPEEEKFYCINNYCDKLEPGKEFTIKRSIDAWVGYYDLSPLICLPEKELTAKGFAAHLHHAQFKLIFGEGFEHDGFTVQHHLHVSAAIQGA